MEPLQAKPAGRLDFPAPDPGTSTSRAATDQVSRTDRSAAGQPLKTETHFYRNLLAAHGEARVSSAPEFKEKADNSAHKALHDLVEKEKGVQVRILGKMKDGTIDKKITLSTLNPAAVKGGIEKEVSSLDLIIGTMYADGFVKYVKSEVNLAEIRKSKATS